MEHARRPRNPHSFAPENHRRSLRLRGFDYSEGGAYFCTICVQGRISLLGTVEAGEVRLNDGGQMVQAVWEELPRHYPGLTTDAFVVMPNHVHGILLLEGRSVGEPGARGSAGKGFSLADGVHRFKTMTTKRYADGVKSRGWPAFRSRLWQRNYFEHVIRNEEALHRLRRYILENPARWDRDAENPRATAPEGRAPWDPEAFSEI